MTDAPTALVTACDRRGALFGVTVRLPDGGDRTVWRKQESAPGERLPVSRDGDGAWVVGA